MTSRHRVIAVVQLSVLLLFLPVFSPQAQQATGPGQPAVPPAFSIGEIPEEYQSRIRDLVERYEQARILLREQIQRNTELYTQEEIDAATADLEAELAQVRMDNEALRREYKSMAVHAKNYRDETLQYKEHLVKTQFELENEIETLGSVIDSIEEETLLQVGTTFSPSGQIGAIGLLNLPGTAVSLVTEGIYDVRDKEFFASFGVAFGLFPPAEPRRRFPAPLPSHRGRRELTTAGAAFASPYLSMIHFGHIRS